jgi:hypothetical protein
MGVETSRVNLRSKAAISRRLEAPRLLRIAATMAAVSRTHRINTYQISLAILQWIWR